jgi:hypothetical protein
MDASDEGALIDTVSAPQPAHLACNSGGGPLPEPIGTLFSPKPQHSRFPAVNLHEGFLLHRVSNGCSVETP